MKWKERLSRPKYNFWHILIFFCVSYTMHSCRYECVRKPLDIHICTAPTIPYVQQLLVDEGYDLGESGADGVCGDKTAIAWTEWSQATVEHENYLKCK